MQLEVSLALLHQALIHVILELCFLGKLVEVQRPNVINQIDHHDFKRVHRVSRRIHLFVVYIALHTHWRWWCGTKVRVSGDAEYYDMKRKPQKTVTD